MGWSLAHQADIPPEPGDRPLGCRRTPSSGRRPAADLAARLESRLRLPLLRRATRRSVRQPWRAPARKASGRGRARLARTLRVDDSRAPATRRRLAALGRPALPGGAPQPFVNLLGSVTRIWISSCCAFGSIGPPNAPRVTRSARGAASLPSAWPRQWSAFWP